MLNEEEYSSDTSDEDFIPQGTGAESDDDSVSEGEKDDQLEDDCEDSPKGGKRKKGNTKIRQRKKKKAKMNPLLATIETTAPDEEEDEKEDLKKTKTEENPEKVDSLWADFLADVDEAPKENKAKVKPKNSWGSLLSNKKNTTTETTSTKGTAPVVSATKPKPSTVKVTKVFEFAGEEVRVEKEVDADSAEAKVAALTGDAKSESSEKSAKPQKRLGISNIVGLLDNKKQKLSTLEKTKLDWNAFKSSEGIESQLQTHLKSKEGYLEKQAFLERADLRQFEIERNMRMGKRSNR